MRDYFIEFVYKLYIKLLLTNPSLLTALASVLFDIHIRHTYFLRI